MSIPSWLLERKEREIQQALFNLRALPDVKRSEVADEDSCPICLLSLGSIFEEHEETGRKGDDSSNLTSGNASGTAIPITGVVKLMNCGHIFCRKDLAEWIESHHGCCPICRRTFFEFTLIDEAEYESSDGGEYIPEDDDDYDGNSDEADLDLVASSDFDTEMDDATFDEDEDEVALLGYTPLTRIHASTSTDADTSDVDHNHSSLVYQSHPNDDSHICSSESESNVIGSFRDELEDVGELSYGSDSPSSGGSSSNVEDGSEACIADVSIASDDFDTNREKLRGIQHPDSGLKSPAVPGFEPSGALDNVARH